MNRLKSSCGVLLRLADRSSGKQRIFEDQEERVVCRPERFIGNNNIGVMEGVSLYLTGLGGEA